MSDGVRVEEVGDDVIVLDRTGSAIHRATGDAADVLRLATTGDEIADVPAHLAAAVASLTDAGVLAPSGISRRRMLLAAGAVGGGLASFALATPAHALSVCPIGTPATNPGTFDYSGTFTTGPGVTSVTVQAWGGGGGGADDVGMMGNAGGGGGGGAFRAESVLVTECTSYTIVVGGGGNGGSMGGMGMDGVPDPGGPSSFGGTLFVVNGGAGASGSSGGAGGAGPTFAGGAGAPANGGNGGGGGGSAGASGPGGAAAGQMGGAAGAGSPAGAPGGAGGNDMANGSPGSTPGGGGGGAGDVGMSGGSGAPGRVIVIVP